MADKLLFRRRVLNMPESHSGLRKGSCCGGALVSLYTTGLLIKIHPHIIIQKDPQPERVQTGAAIYSQPPQHFDGGTIYENITFTAWLRRMRQVHLD